MQELVHQNHFVVYPNTFMVFEYLCNRANIRANRVFVSSSSKNSYTFHRLMRIIRSHSVCACACVRARFCTNPNMFTQPGMLYKEAWVKEKGTIHVQQMVSYNIHHMS